jgi:hypothetical protein
MMKFRLTHPALKTSICVERVMGIEPTYQAWEARVLPLNYTRIAMRWPSKGWVAGFVKRAVWDTSWPGSLLKHSWSGGRWGKIARMERGNDQCPGFNDQGMCQGEKIQLWPSRVATAFVMGTWALPGALASWSLVIPRSITGHAL